MGICPFVDVVDGEMPQPRKHAAYLAKRRNSTRLRESRCCEEGRTLTVFSMRASRSRVEGRGLGTDVPSRDETRRTFELKWNSAWRDEAGSGNSLFGTRRTTFPRDGICGYEWCRGSISKTQRKLNQGGRGPSAGSQFVPRGGGELGSLRARTIRTSFVDKRSLANKEWVGSAG